MFIIVFIEENFKNLEKNTQNSKYQTSKVCDLSVPAGQQDKMFFQEILKLMTKFQPFDLHLLFFLKISRKFV